MITRTVRHLARLAYRLMPDAVTSARGLPVSIETVDLLRAPPAARDAARARLADLLTIGFSTVDAAAHADRARFIADYTAQVTDIEVNAIYCTVRFVRDGARTVAALLGFVREVDIDGRPIELLAGSVAVHPDYRGHRLLNITVNRMIADYLGQSYRSGRERYFIGCVMTPVTYAYMVRRTPHAYPSPGWTHDARMEAILQRAMPDRAADGLVWEVVGPAPSTRTSAWIAAHRDTPEVSLYLARNPAFARGYSLPILIRLRASDLVRTVGRILRIETGRRLRRRRGRLRRA